MKAVFIHFMLMTLLVSSSTVLAQKKRSADSVDVSIYFKERKDSNAPVDSVFIFFDRFDHSGAGIIKEIAYPVNNTITITRVPEGRYYIGVLCLGAHQQYFSEVTFVNKRRSNQLKFLLDRSEEYTPGLFTPFMAVNLSKLAITNPRSFK